jgi:methionyl-tRNA synthetase
LTAIYGVDAFRYFLLREVPFGADGDFSEKSLLARYNSELANNLGNLFQRSVTILVKNFAGVIPSLNRNSQLLADGPAFARQLESDFETCAYGDVLESLVKRMINTNKFIEDKAPWKLGGVQKEALGEILYECFSVLKFLAIYLYPFMPNKMGELWSALGEKIDIPSAGLPIISLIKEGKPIPFAPRQIASKGPPLFMRK